MKMDKVNNVAAEATEEAHQDEALSDNDLLSMFHVD